VKVPVLAVLLLATLSAAAPARAEAEADRLAALLELRPGVTVAEIGAGDGELTLAIAARVGATGRVYATEIEAEKQDAIRAVAQTPASPTSRCCRHSSRPPAWPQAAARRSSCATSITT